MEERKEHGKENKPERGESSCQQNSSLYANGWKWNPTSMASDGNVIYVQPISQVIVYPCLSLTEWETVAVSIIYVFLLAKQWMVWCHSNVSLRTSEMLTVTSDFHVPLKWWYWTSWICWQILYICIHLNCWQTMILGLNVCTENVDIFWNKCVHWTVDRYCMGLHVQIQKILTWEGPRDIEVFQGDPRQIFGSFTV